MDKDFEHLDPVTCGPGEHKDSYSEGTGNSRSRVVDITGMVKTSPVYFDGTKAVDRIGITDPDLFPDGLKDDKRIFVYPSVAKVLRSMDNLLRDFGMSLDVYSGFISPEVQFEKFKRLQSLKNPSDLDPLGEMDAGKWADSAGGGSMARLLDVNGPEVSQAMDICKQDIGLMRELFDMVNCGVGKSVDSLLLELLAYRASSGRADLRVDVSTATTIHNLGRSFNVGITDTANGGGRLFMGAPLDVPGPYQRLDFYEGATPRKVEKLLEQDPFFRRYFESDGVTSVDEEVIRTARDNRRILMDLFRQFGVSAYKNELGHGTVPPRDGNFPSRKATYRKVDGAKG